MIGARADQGHSGARIDRRARARRRARPRGPGSRPPGSCRRARRSRPSGSWPVSRPPSAGAAAASRSRSVICWGLSAKVIWTWRVSFPTRQYDAERQIVLAQQLDGADHPRRGERFHRVLRPPAAATLAEPVLAQVLLVASVAKRPKRSQTLARVSGLRRIRNSSCTPSPAIPDVAAARSRARRKPGVVKTSFRGGCRTRMTNGAFPSPSRRVGRDLTTGPAYPSSQMTSNRWKRDRKPFRSRDGDRRMRRPCPRRADARRPRRGPGRRARERRSGRRRSPPRRTGARARRSARRH